MEAKNINTGNINTVTTGVTVNTSNEVKPLTKAQKEKAIKEAEEMAESDKNRRELADVKNEASSLVFQTEKALDDLKEDIATPEKDEIKKLIGSLEAALKGDDVQFIKEAKAALEAKAQGIAAKAYEKNQQAQANQSNQEPNEDTKDSKHTVDAEFESKN